jgi:hypothetical protein
MKPIRWTPYSRKKLDRRDVTESEVKKTVAQPDSVSPGKPPRKIFARRYFDQILQTDMLLRVVLEETETEIVIRHPLQDFEVHEV